jgi:hypothetical protein
VKPRLRLLLGMGLLALAAAGVAHADAAVPVPTFAARCEAAARREQVHVQAGEAGWRVDNSRSWRMLTQMKRTGVPGAYVLGLTHTESRVAIQVEGQLLQDAATGAECIAPRVDVRLRYLPVVIYVGSEFKPHTCPYREILAHEMRHLNAYLTFLPKVEERVRVRVAERFDGKPVYGRRGETQAALRREIDTRWMPYVKDEMSRVETLQAGIDTPQEYARLSKVCQGAVKSLIGSTRAARS